MSFLKTTAIQHLNATTPAISLTANGDVGLGITNPTFDSGTGLEIQRPDVSTVRIDSVNNSTALELKAAVGAVAVSGRGNYPLLMETNGIERMRIDSAGRITMPNQPAFSVSYSGGGYVASEGDSNTWDAVLWNTATGSGRFNNGNHYNGATGCFTAPVSGKYMFMTQIHHHAGGGTTSGYAYMDLAFGTTGSQAAIVGATSFHRNIMSLTTDTWWEMPPQVTILNLAANDSIFVRIVNTGGATFLGSSRADHNRWSCWFLG